MISIEEAIKAVIRDIEKMAVYKNRNVSILKGQSSTILQTFV